MDFPWCLFNWERELLFLHLVLYFLFWRTLQFLHFIDHKIKDRVQSFSFFMFHFVLLKINVNKLLMSICYRCGLVSQYMHRYLQTKTKTKKPGKRHFNLCLLQVNRDKKRVRGGAGDGSGWAGADYSEHALHWSQAQGQGPQGQQGPHQGLDHEQRQQTAGQAGAGDSWVWPSRVSPLEPLWSQQFDNFVITVAVNISNILLSNNIHRIKTHRGAQ